MNSQIGVTAVGMGEAAKSLSISPWTIRKMIKNGNLKATRFCRRVLIEPAELQKLIEKGRQQQTAQKGASS